MVYHHPTSPIKQQAHCVMPQQLIYLRTAKQNTYLVLMINSIKNTRTYKSENAVPAGVLILPTIPIQLRPQLIAYIWCDTFCRSLTAISLLDIILCVCKTLSSSLASIYVCRPKLVYCKVSLKNTCHLISFLLNYKTCFRRLQMGIHHLSVETTVLMEL